MILRKPEWRRWGGWAAAVVVLGLGSGPGMAQCVPAPDGLVSWWPGDGSASDIASNNPGTLEGGATSSAPGYVGSCFTFDGTNGFVQIANAPSLEPTNLTVEAWVRFDGLDSAGSGGSYPGEQYIVFKQNTRTNYFEGYFLGKVRVSGRDAFAFGVSSATGLAVEVNSSFTVTTNQWCHVAGVRGPDFIQLYVNGELEGQTNVNFPQDYGPQPVYFGTSGEPYWDHKLKGELDEVSLYNRALGSNEIAAIYAAGHLGKCKTPTIISVALTPGSLQTAQLFPLLTIAGLSGQPFGIQASYLPLEPTNLWVGLTNLTLSAPTALWMDTSAATGSQRFYRALPGSLGIPSIRHSQPPPSQ